MQHKRTISNQEKKATSRENKNKSSKPPNLFTGNKIHTTIYHLASNSQRKHHSPPQKLIKQEKNQIKKSHFQVQTKQQNQMQRSSGTSSMEELARRGWRGRQDGKREREPKN